MSDLRNRCPLHLSDERLERAHQHWHQAKEDYFEPDGFVRQLNVTIMTLRTVTWILQTKKGIFPNFDNWYRQWQDRMRGMGHMTWLVDARNKIEKQGDLSTASLARLHLHRGLNQPSRATFTVSPRLSPEQVIQYIRFQMSKQQHDFEGVLSLERLWSVPELRGQEILTVLSECYGTLATLLDDAHRELGFPDPATLPTQKGEPERQHHPPAFAGRLPCMVVHEVSRRQWFAWPSLEPIEFQIRHETNPMKREGLRRRIEDHYQYLPLRHPDIRAGLPLRTRLANAFETARHLFLYDGFHATMLFGYRDAKEHLILTIPPFSKEDTVPAWSRIGEKLVLEGVTEVLIIAEGWYYQPGEGEAPPEWISDREDKIEVLWGVALQSNGECASLVATVLRSEHGAIRLTDTIEINTLPRVLIPLLRTWQRAHA